MKEHPKALEKLVKALPADIREEVRDFVDFVIQKRAKKPHGKPKFDWAGALKDLRDKYSSVELQHDISEWRIGGK